ncbi:MAG TPA: hypothetical protein VII33_11735 [Nakamurella sp.]
MINTTEVPRKYRPMNRDVRVAVKAHPAKPTLDGKRVTAADRRVEVVASL